MEENQKKEEKRRFQICCLLFILLTMGCFFASCLFLTRDREKVEILSLKTERKTKQKKRDSKEVWKEETLREQLGIVEHIKDEIKNEDKTSTIHIDASVEVPEVTGLGEIVVQPCKPDYERETKIREVFANERNTYKFYFTDWEKEIPSSVTDCKKEISGDKMYYISEPFQVVRNGQVGDYGDVAWTEEELKKIWEENGMAEDKRSFSLEEGKKRAEELIRKCGFGSFVCTDSYIMPEINYKEGSIEDGMEVIYDGKAAYFFTFTRLLEEIPLLTSDLYLNCKEKKELPSYFFWPNERIEISLDEQGVISMTAHGLLELAGMEKEYVPLLTYEEMKKVCQKMLLPYLTKEYIEEGLKKMDATIKRISLGYMRTTDYNALEEGKIRGILKPVWCFYGSTNLQYENGDYGFVGSDQEELLLTVDARTGEVMEYEAYK